ncbi:MAG: CDP-alcohol phosphatidyltransferase family protein [Sporichthyaceae bacterium]
MTSLILVVDAAADDGGPAALLPAPAAISGSPGTVLGRLLAQLARYGLSPAAVVARSDWHSLISPHLPSSTPIMGYLDTGGALASLASQFASSPGPVVVVHADVVLHDGLLGDLVADPRLANALISVPADPPRIRVHEGRVLAAGSASHAIHGANASAGGLLRIAHEDLEPLVGACWEMSGMVTVLGWTSDLSELLSLALVRVGGPVAAIEAGGYVCARPRNDADAIALATRLAQISEHRIRLARVARPDDGFYSTFVVRRISPKLTDFAVRRMWSPNAITMIALVVALAAAECFWRGTTLWLIVGALLLQVSLCIDCVDGETARYTRRFTPLGAWLDATTDRVKEYAVYAGLALGAARTGDPVWTLAAATLALQVFRNFVDFGFVATIPSRTPPPPPRVSLRETEPSGGPAGEDALAGRGVAVMGQGAIALSNRTSKTAALKWAKRMVFLPIGERWLIISVAAAVSGPRAVFVVLLALGAVSAVYATAGRVLRALAAPAPRTEVAA